MTIEDPIADMLTRIRNANERFHETVVVPRSGFKEEIAKILKAEGYIGRYERIQTDGRDAIQIHLKYKGDRKDRKRVISGLKRVSKPSRRIYVKVNEIPQVLGGLGIAILSTSQGLMTGQEARHAGVGGELLCLVW
ncbi:MAG: 30S ribosomal protein S8 [Candidatus Bipolaricaulia bacterium]